MRINHAFLLGSLCALAPNALSAATLLSLLTADLDAITRLSLGTAPLISDFEEKTVLINGLQEVEAFVPAGFDFRERPSPSNPGFGSAQGDAFGNFGVGANSFFLSAGAPPFITRASGFFEQNILNDTSEEITLGTSISIPTPVIQLAGQIGNFFPPGRDPEADIAAEVSARIVATVTRLDGSTEESLLLDYGMKVERDPTDGQIKPTLSRDAQGLVANEGAGFFFYELAAFDGNFGTIAVLAPGESLKLDFQYFARVTNGTGESGVFAAIGDPFDINASGGRFGFAVLEDGGLEPPPAPVPLPAGLPLLAAGLAALAGARVLRGHR